VFAFAAAGLLLGHAISYLLVVPDPYHRDLVLQRTGHEYLPMAGQAAVVLVLGALAALLARGWTARRDRDPGGFGSLVALLGMVQVTAFVGQEVVERLVSRVPLHTLGHDHLLATGIGVQLVVALVGAAALWWLARVSVRIAESVRGARTGRPRPALAMAARSTADVPRAGIARTPRSPRAPPLP
jgi:hypothetical protein